jgi:hypothetical protein
MPLGLVARLSFVLILFGIGLACLDYCSPLHADTALAYTLLAVMIIAALSLAWPLKLFFIPSRKAAGAVLAVATVTFFAVLSWPVPLRRAAPGSPALDRALPVWHFHELHSVPIHAPAAVVWRAVDEVTFSEVPIFAKLAGIREGRLARGQTTPILTVVTRPGRGFFVLERNDKELVLGLAGRFWRRHPVPGISKAAEFATYNEPGAARAAANLRLEDLGDGWTQLTSETRIQGTDDAGRRAFGRYWRLIYPGSGWIRAQWLEAIRRRAETVR